MADHRHNEVTPAVVDLRFAGDLAPADIGVKGWYLAQLSANGFPSPAGFVIPASVYEKAIATNRVGPRLERIWEAARHADRSEVQALSRTARHLIAEIRLDVGTTRQIDAFVESLGRETALAVRSSATPTAVSGPECAGVHMTYTGVIGLESVAGRLHSCWASLFGERALAMRSRGLGDDHPSMAVVVQKLVPASKSGIVVPIGPSDEVLIEATFGLGEPIVSGAVEPDRYVTNRLDSAQCSVTIGRKQIVLPADPSQGHTFAAPDVELQRVLDDDELRRITDLSAHVDRHFDDHHEVEWAIAGDVVYILQVRPFALAEPDTEGLQAPHVDGMVSGLGVGLGTATGRVFIAAEIDDLERMRDGDVIVASATEPTWRPFIARACAIVTDTGDEHGHAARIAREYGIPAVVGTKHATTSLDHDTAATVDATRGWVFPRQGLGTSAV